MEFNVLEMGFFMIKRKVLNRKVLHNFHQIIMDLGLSSSISNSRKDVISHEAVTAKVSY